MRVLMMRGMMMPAMRVRRRAGVRVSMPGVVIATMSALVGGLVVVLLVRLGMVDVRVRVNMHMMTRRGTPAARRMLYATAPRAFHCHLRELANDEPSFFLPPHLARLAQRIRQVRDSTHVHGTHALRGQVCRRSTRRGDVVLMLLLLMVAVDAFDSPP